MSLSVVSEACRCIPWCGGIVNPGWGRSSPSPDDDRHGGADNPCQETVGERPKPVQEVEPVKGELDGCVFAGEPAVPLPGALCYGTGLETRPIFTRTVCHSHAKRRPHLSMTGVPRCCPANQRPKKLIWLEGFLEIYTQTREYLRRGISSAVQQGRSHVGLDPECTEAAVKRHRRFLSRTKTNTYQLTDRHVLTLNSQLKWKKTKLN